MRREQASPDGGTHDDALAVLRQVERRTADIVMAGKRATAGTRETMRQGPSPAEVFAAMRQVSDYAAKGNARLQARLRVREFRDLAGALVRLAERAERWGVCADRLREEAARFARITTNYESGLRIR